MSVLFANRDLQNVTNANLTLDVFAQYHCIMFSDIASDDDSGRNFGQVFIMREAKKIIHFS